MPSLHNAGMAGQVPQRWQQLQIWLLAHELLDVGRDHWADLHQQHAAGLESRRRLLDKRSGDVDAALAGMQRHVWFVLVNVRR